MGAVYGVLFLVIGMAAIVVTAWAVDRLDAQQRGPKRVLWRPWYRTAIVSAICFLTGVFFALEFETMWIPFVTFAVLLGLQLRTRSGIALQALETFSMSLSLYGGLILMRWSDLGAPDSFERLIDLRFSRAFIGCMAWAILGSIVAALSTKVFRAFETRGSNTREPQ